MGEMGFPIAGNLSKHYPVAVWNRTVSKSLHHQEIFKTSAVTSQKPFDRDMSNTEFIFSCLPTSKEVKIYTEMLLNTSSNLRKDLIWVDNTSGAPLESKNIALDLIKSGVGYVDAPVSGGRLGASTGTLAVMVGGPNEYFIRVKPLLEKLAKSLIHIGENVGCAHAVKSLNNLLYASNVLFIMKAAQSLRKQGIDIEKALKTINESSGGSNSSRRMLHYETNGHTIGLYFKVKLMIKDIDIAFSMMKGKENDPVFKVFNEIRTFYYNSAQEDWENFDIFDMYQVIEEYNNKG
ncbi:hypothetical protein SteCoe_36656 [Stentor coeruleus]|uniref:3-hydroxyisobutyrate dehydrogenase n=1 Tax=Stentor coeruleus TaxID=5963 RepID=A0A1R2APN5_9CILI|nr:hypothetical protein SteCoe_36656 [Stentor coeruleus]